MEIRLNRIDGNVALPALWPKNVSFRGDRALIELRLSDDHDIELSFPAPGEDIREEWVWLGSEVLAHLAEMDNEVQRGCQEERAKSDHHSIHYESYLAAINLSSPDEVVLRYFGAVVNTEWDERFVRVGDRWVKGFTI